MQRDAVHRRRHGVLADAIVNVAAFEAIGPHRLLRLGPRQVGMGQIGGAAEQIRQRLGDAVDHELRRLPGRNVRPLGGEAIAQPRHRVDIAARQIAIERIVKRRTRSPTLRRLVRSIQLRRAACPRAPALRHCARTASGIWNGCVRPVQRIAGLCDFLGAERRAMRFFAALTVRRAEADHRAAGDQRRPVVAARPFDGGCDRFGVVTVDRGRPTIRRPRSRASWSSEHDSDVAPSIEISLSSNSTIRRLSLRWPASEIASWLRPSIRQPSPAMT